SPRRLPPSAPPFPYTTLFRSVVGGVARPAILERLDRRAAGMDAIAFERTGRRHHRAGHVGDLHQAEVHLEESEPHVHARLEPLADRKSTRLNSSDVKISYAVF